MKDILRFVQSERYLKTYYFLYLSLCIDKMNSTAPSTPVFVPGYIYNAQCGNSGVRSEDTQGGNGAAKRTRYSK